MNEIEVKICENMLDALDRLFDRESDVIDIYALIFASNEVLGDSFSDIDLGNIAVELDRISRNGKSVMLQREKSLQATNNFRELLNERLSI